MYPEKEENEDSIPIDVLLTSDNIAELLSVEELIEIGSAVVDGYTVDVLSRAGWLKRYETALKLATQVFETKSWPWPKASNVKFPLMTIACLQFHARAYPSLVPSKGLVDAKVVGRDPQGIKANRAERIKLHMNYQIMDEMDNWEEEMDRLLLTLPLTGSEFKKVYWDSDSKKNCSEHVFARDLVINYHTKSLDSAQRITQELEFSSNELLEKMRSGIYLDVDLDNNPTLESTAVSKVEDKIQGLTPPESDGSSSVRMILEQHTWYDLDGDGYKEPYVCIVDKDTKKVLRIVARYSSDNIKRNKKKEIYKIIPNTYYTQYTFIPSPDGGIYGMGFGTLIGPLNEAVNTLINQLVDAGTVSNLQSGFISKSFKTKGGTLQFQPNEWKLVNVTGQDLKNGIMPLPAGKPSAVLFQLLGFLVDIGQRVTSTTDILVGESPGQNQKATTTNAVVENGMRVFTAIYKRIRKALGREFKLLYALNKDYLKIKDYINIINPNTRDQMELEIAKNDYEDETIDIVPTADANAVSSTTKIMKAQALVEIAKFGGFNEYEVKRRFLEAMEIEDIDIVLPPPDSQQAPPQKPDPDMLGLQIKAGTAQHDAEIANRDMTVKEREQARKEFETKVKAADMQRTSSQKDAHKTMDNETKMQTAVLGAAAKMASDKEKSKKNAENKD